MAMRSAVKKNKRKSQREAARLQKQAEADLVMEEDDEIHFNRPETTTNTPRVSRNNTPDPEDDIQEETEYTVVLEMIKNVRDKLAALSLDNTNIRAACDDLRRQCHSQGVAFGELSRLVRQSREDQEETRAYTQEETRPYPRIRPELIDDGGNLRAEDIGTSMQREWYRYWSVGMFVLLGVIPGLADGISHHYLQPRDGNRRDHWNRCFGFSTTTYPGH